MEKCIADIAVICDSDLNQIGCFVNFIHHNYAGLLLITSWSGWIGKFHRSFVELFSATYAGWCWLYGIYFSINPCSSSKWTWMYLQTLSWHSRYFVGERPSQRDMMWWMFSFSTRQIRHVSSSSTLKKYFLMHLVEIACFWMAIVDSVDLFRVEGFSHWLDCPLSTWGWSRYFAKLHMHVHSFEFSVQSVDTCGFDGEFPWQFLYGSQLLNIMANSIKI